MSTPPFISIVIPVKNASALVRACLESLRALEYPADRREVILVDGMSSDDTRALGESLGARVVDNPLQTVAPARTIGFSHARGDYVAFTDADCTFDTHWLSNSITYFDGAGIAGVSGPTVTPEGRTAFERAVKYLFVFGSWVSGCVHRERIQTVSKTDDLPGCNAVYRKEWLARVMPVDDRLLTAEDVEMNFRLRRLGATLLFAPDVIVYHCRRSTPRSLAVQMYRFAVGRLQVAKKDIRMIKVAHLVAGLGIPLILGGEFLLFRGHPVYLLFNVVVLVPGLIVWFLSRSFRAGCMFPAVLAISLCSWSWGFLTELFFPLKNAAGK